LSLPRPVTWYVCIMVIPVEAIIPLLVVTVGFSSGNFYADKNCVNCNVPTKKFDSRPEEAENTHVSIYVAYREAIL